MDDYRWQRSYLQAILSLLASKLSFQPGLRWMSTRMLMPINSWIFKARFFAWSEQFAGKRLCPELGKGPVFRPKNSLRGVTASGHHSVPLPADAPAIHGPKRKTHSTRR